MSPSKQPSTSITTLATKFGLVTSLSPLSNRTLTTLHKYSPSFHESSIAFLSYLPTALDPYTKYSWPPSSKSVQGGSSKVLKIRIDAKNQEKEALEVVSRRCKWTSYSNILNWVGDDDKSALWIFRSQDLAPHEERDVASFKDFSKRELQIGVPSYQDTSSYDSIPVVIQHPC
ncbi:hypothetical protein Tco_0071239 [Tanacetum coccineum]